MSERTEDEIFDESFQREEVKRDTYTERLELHKKLELLRRINCLGGNDIEKAFGRNNENIMNKYIRCREEHGSYGNFKFIFDLDEENAEKLFKRIGYVGVDLGDKK